MRSGRVTVPGRGPFWIVRRFARGKNCGQAGGLGDLREIAAAGLLGGFKAEAAPALDAFAGCLGQMFFRPLCQNGHDAARAKLDRFLDGPLHAVEFEDAEEQCDGERGCGFKLLEEREADAVAVDGCDAGEPCAAAGDNVKLHAGLGAQHAAEVLRLIAVQCGRGFVPCIGDPAAARHAPHSIVSRAAKGARKNTSGDACLRPPSLLPCLG